MVHRLHARFSAIELNRRINHVRFVVADEVSNARCGDENFECNRSALSRGIEQKLLADDAFEHERELSSDLVVLRGRKDVDDSIDGLGTAVGV